jgi:hypothetical protein
MQFLFLQALKVFLLTSMILFTIGCDDDDHDHDEEHIDADGFVLDDESGAGVYREFEGALDGAVILNVGDTLKLSVHFLDHDENEIEYEEDELLVSENDPNVAIIEVDEHHEMAIHVIGVSSGSTSFKLQLMHQGHADYTSTNNVSVIVN